MDLNQNPENFLFYFLPLFSGSTYTFDALASVVNLTAKID